MLNRFANPIRFLRLADQIQPWAAILTLVLFAAGLYFALFNSPPDYQQGETVRIMYIHVPSAWMALFCYTLLAITSGVAMIWKHPLANLAGRATAPIGATFTFLALITGSIWGKPMWGTWWVWDARLTSMFILFFLYLGYIALQDAFDNAEGGSKAAAILALVGFINVPIIKFSVDWWNTLHQPASVIKFSGPAIHSTMLTPLLLTALAFKGYYVWLFLINMRGEIAEARCRALQVSQIQNAQVAKVATSDARDAHAD
ncbi:MAG: heme transporter HemC [Rhodospirillaceae bacterium TMED8]|nr:heme transporter HemC [Magnetovibrio sp.]OUT52161.1 MAG: heme transporter HemC [Rhodospirillaceae bacterium TMED8]|tara:strand:- start:1177 stop:1950 length:774 start_codon:yes stop_codon:yes gene_type:complete